MTKPQPNVLAINATAASLLGFLHEQSMTGWRLQQIATQRIGNFWHFTPSQVYSELDKLAGRGYVDVSERGQRASRLFAINGQGRQAFAEWLNQQPAREQIRFPMLLVVSFAKYVSPVRLCDILREYKTAHSLQLDEYLRQKSDLLNEPDAKDDVRTLSFGIEYEEMTLAWIESVIQELTEQIKDAGNDK